ncbi:hypothetical protein [Psychroflexus sp. ALD_RP9]|uniref:hypothetical protein n=1 Tax=Psychroflexus sp. ALD_RP9 TaxID=2777186 RepID=UPI001A906C1B|nr:hypothetical protein [Psychroflexus sp. ALD_RP9]QSS97514.1 hypothetical protein IMZ30_02030 [Psychroflexus sp. ALD_RP9]
MKQVSLFLFILIVVSCGTKKGLHDNAVHLYKGQLKFINGAYHNQAVNTFEDISLLNQLQITYNSKVELVNLRLLNEKELEVSFHDSGQFQTQIIKGKYKNGGFSFKKKTKWFGIPLLFFFKKQNHSYTLYGQRFRYCY